MKSQPISDASDASSGKPVLAKPKMSYWRKIGGGSLFISLVIHGIIVAVGLVLIVTVIPPPPEKMVDFKTRGGGGGAPAGSVSQQKKQAHLSKTSASRLAAQGSTSNFTLPEPETTSGLTALGSLGGGGAGGLGKGGGIGTGKGTGAGSGMGVGMGAGGKNLMVFGTSLNVRTIGVVMDVSGSMTSHLEKVLDELDKVAKGSPVVLHVGCGISPGKSKEHIEPIESPMRGSKKKDPFKEFWYLNQDPYYRSQPMGQKEPVDFDRPIPLPDIYKFLAKRQKTYFFEFEGVRTTGYAILSKELKDVEAIYWFADFQDAIDPKEAEEVLKALVKRKQKLFIHSSADGRFLDAARDLLAIPSGGKEIVTKDKRGKKD